VEPIDPDEYPQYRQLVGAERYYRIDSAESVLELQRLGARTVALPMQAKAYPDLLFIQDLLGCAEGRYAPLSAIAFQALLSEAILL
jgi:hypothetical protein